MGGVSGVRNYLIILRVCSFAIWDSRTNTLTLARDGIGVKPLFYSVKNNSLYFSSEIKGILATQKFRNDTDPLAFYSYLSSDFQTKQNFIK